MGAGYAQARMIRSQAFPFDPIIAGALPKKDSY
jgi:hypothetical protein